MPTVNEVGKPNLDDPRIIELLADMVDEIRRGKTDGRTPTDPRRAHRQDARQTHVELPGMLPG